MRKQEDRWAHCSPILFFLIFRSRKSLNSEVSFPAECNLPALCRRHTCHGSVTACFESVTRLPPAYGRQAL